MKKQLLTAFIALAAFSVQAQWINQFVPFGYEGYISDIRVTDPNTVWGTSIDPAIHGTTPYTQDWVRTIDGGNTWTTGSVNAGGNWVISNIWPIDADTCYVVMFDSVAGSGGREYKTTDGGASWAQVGANMFQASASFADMNYFWNAQNGIAIGDPTGAPKKYEIYLTTDYGNTWTQVPAANLPSLSNGLEFSITNLFDAIDGYIWFGTTYGDIYRSVDGGNNWTKTPSGFPASTGTSRQDISSIAFSDSLHGMITQVVGGASPTILVKTTSDAGLTWIDAPFTPGTTPMFSGDLTGVPGSPNTFVSAGSNADFGFGTSFTKDGGQNWILIDDNFSHTSIDFLDSVTGYSGEYILAGASIGGAWKFDGALATVTCSSPDINPGISTANDNTVCFNDTLSVTTAGVLAPTEGTVHGFSILLSSADISGNNDPISSGVIVGGTGVIQGTPPATQIVNNQAVFAPGIYYFTPLVYGNATDPVGNLQSFDLVYDPNCTYTGTSIFVNLLDFGDPACAVGIPNYTMFTLSVKSYMMTPDLLNVRVNAPKNDNNTKITIFDFTGRSVYSNNHSVVAGVNDIGIDVSNLSGGTYLVQTISSGSVVTNKLVKM
jgi:photosystem II stability/assembly factor-like uncharacterized protein